MAAASSLARRYGPSFRSVASTLRVQTGFALIPIHSPSRDVTKALGSHLAERGFRVALVAPVGEEWRSLLASLIDARPQEGTPVVLLAGPEPDDEGPVREALRLLNQRRDALAEALGCPLLWAGTREFLRLSWDRAPDFWSVRALPLRLDAPQGSLLPWTSTSTSDVEAGEVGLERLERLFEQASRQGAPETTARLGLRLADALVAQYRMREALALAERLVTLCRSHDLPNERAAALVRTTRVHIYLGRLADAERGLAEAQSVAADPAVSADLLRVAGDLDRRRARLAEAEAAYAAALSLYQALEDRRGEANTLWALGELYVQTDRLAEAEASYARALQLYQTADARLGEANTHKAQGDLYVRTDRLKEAEASYVRALSLCQAIEDRLGEANTHLALGGLYLQTVRWPEAERAFARALSLYQAIEDRLGEANTHLMLGELHARTERLTDAEASYARAQALYRALEDRLGEANTHFELGNLYVRTDRLTDAEASYARALPHYQASKVRIGEASTHRALGDLYVRTARLSEAEASYACALALYEAIESRLGVANTRSGMGRLALLREEPERAWDAFLAARTALVEFDDALGAASQLVYLSRAALDAGRADRAVVLAAEAWTSLRTLANRAEQMLALWFVTCAAEAAGERETTTAAAVLCWFHANELGNEQIAQEVAPLVEPLLDLVDLPAGDTQQVVLRWEDALVAAVRPLRQRLEARGEGLFDPLSPPSAPHEASG